MLVTADVEGLLVKKANSTESVCAGRKVSFGDTASDSFGFGQATGSTENVSIGKSGIALGASSPATKMVGELMYRACELSLNLKLSEEKTIGLYKEFLAAAVEISSHSSYSNSESMDSNSDESDDFDDEDESDEIAASREAANAQLQELLNQ